MSAWRVYCPCLVMNYGEPEVFVVQSESRLNNIGNGTCACLKIVKSKQYDGLIKLPRLNYYKYTTH